jgi:hypothetical protein
MFSQPAMTCFKYQMYEYLYGSEAIAYLMLKRKQHPLKIGNFQMTESVQDIPAAPTLF